MSTMKDKWIDTASQLMMSKAQLYVGPRKIIRGQRVTFPLDDSLTMRDCGYTKAKTKMLTRHYLHKESHAAAVKMWHDYTRARRKYGSVGFTTYNHFVKAGGRGGLMMPCIQSVTITWLNKNQYAVDVFYRMTEWLKKFPADLVFIRDVLLEPFDFSDMECTGITCHFANITMTAAYFLTIAPHFDPIEVLEDLKRRDRYWYNWLIKWCAYYICKEHEAKILKFSQALRAQKDAYDRLDSRTIKRLQAYVRKNHPKNLKDNDDEADL